jgi:hypothetical protein
VATRSTAAGATADDQHNEEAGRGGAWGEEGLERGERGELVMV